MFSRPSHLFLLLWILLLPTNQAVGSIITIDDHYRNVRWMFVESDVPKEFSKAASWVKKLDTEGYSDWKMPFTPDGQFGDWTYDSSENETKINVTHSELGHLYYTVKEYSATPTTETPPTNRDPFTKRYYWLGTGDDGAQFSSYNNEHMAWAFDFRTGWQFLQSQIFGETYALAVRTELLAKTPVPEPNTAFLFLTGILFLAYRPLSRTQLR